MNKRDKMPSQKERLRRIAEIIEIVDHRCVAADGPVTPTLQEMTQQELTDIYRLARGNDASVRRYHGLQVCPLRQAVRTDGGAHGYRRWRREDFRKRNADMCRLQGTR